MSKTAVLVVDDDSGLRTMLREVLTLEEFPVEMAENGRRAIEILSSEPHKPRIMLLGIVMPVMDGYGVLRWMEGQPEVRARTKIVMMSTAEKLQMVPDNEVDGKVAKPFEVDGLLDALERLS